MAMFQLGVISTCFFLLEICWKFWHWHLADAFCQHIHRSQAEQSNECSDCSRMRLSLHMFRQCLARVIESFDGKIAAADVSQVWFGNQDFFQVSMGSIAVKGAFNINVRSDQTGWLCPLCCFLFHQEVARQWPSESNRVGYFRRGVWHEVLMRMMIKWVDDECPFVHPV